MVHENEDLAICESKDIRSILICTQSNKNTKLFNIIPLFYMKGKRLGKQKEGKLNSL